MLFSPIEMTSFSKGKSYSALESLSFEGVSFQTQFILRFLAFFMTKKSNPVPLMDLGRFLLSPLCLKASETAHEPLDSFLKQNGGAELLQKWSIQCRF